MESSTPAPLTRLDRLFLARTYELAARALGNTAPNPPVGAVIVRDARVVGEGYHHRAGAHHAETNALAQAGNAARGATLYLSLEPCVVAGRVAACAPALVDAGLTRVVCGTRDPNPRNDGRGIAYLRDRGMTVDVAGDARARDLIEPFAGWIASERPFVALKLAMSLDGAIASRAGVQEWLTSEAMRAYVRELRIVYDAVMVGAGTVRVDDPRLSVRPPHDRVRPFTRVVACETDAIAPSSRVFEPVDGYAPTVVLAPAGLRSAFAALHDVATVLFVGNENDRRLDLAAAMNALRANDILSIFCEGGPTLGARLIAASVVDKVYWAIAPVFLSGPHAVPVLAGVDFAALQRRLRFDDTRRIGDDVVIAGSICGV